MARQDLLSEKSGSRSSGPAAPKRFSETRLSACDDNFLTGAPTGRQGGRHTPASPRTHSADGWKLRGRRRVQGRVVALGPLLTATAFAGPSDLIALVSGRAVTVPAEQAHHAPRHGRNCSPPATASQLSCHGPVKCMSPIDSGSPGSAAAKSKLDRHSLPTSFDEADPHARRVVHQRLRGISRESRQLARDSPRLKCQPISVGRISLTHRERDRRTMRGEVGA